MPALHVVGTEESPLETALTALGTWPKVQQYCLSLTTYAAQHREAFGQRPSFMSGAERAAARNGYEALHAEAQQQFLQGSPEAQYISDFARRVADTYSSGYGPK